MANYCNAIRTNYFAVKDEKAFRAFMSGVGGMEEDVELWSKKFDDGITRFGFGCIGGFLVMLIRLLRRMTPSTMLHTMRSSKVYKLM